MGTREPRIFLLRHGETQWSATGRHTGRTDVPLTEVGEREAAAAGRTLRLLRATTEPPALVLASPRSRAVRTAELAGLDVTTTEDLAEWDYGEYEGMTTPQIRQTVPDWTVFSHPVPGGESAADVATRARTVLERASAAAESGDVVLAGHGHFGRVLIASWLGMAAPEGARFALEPASVTVLGHEHGARQLHSLNVPPTVPPTPGE